MPSSTATRSVKVAACVEKLKKSLQTLKERRKETKERLMAARVIEQERGREAFLTLVDNVLQKAYSGRHKGPLRLLVCRHQFPVIVMEDIIDDLKSAGLRVVDPAARDMGYGAKHANDCFDGGLDCCDREYVRRVITLENTWDV